MKVRVISAIVAIAVVVPFIIFGGVLYGLGIGIVAILAYREILMLKKSHNLLPFIPSLLSVILLLLLTFTNFNGENFKYGSTYMHLIVTVLGLLIPALCYKHNEYTMNDAFFLIGTVFLLGLGFNSFILVREEGIKTFLYLVSIPIITDTAAMLIGCKVGKHKMCPKISPNKSWEGSLGGLGFGTLIPILLYLILFGTLNLKIMLGTLILSAMGQVGDLIFSKIKRENDIKDFSKIMPGHGGVLDRLDSTIVIFMTYTFLTYILF